MLISVVIPTYNRVDLVRETLESVFAQTYSPLEIIVVDDGSTDGTGEMLRSHRDRIQTIGLNRGGIGAARNAGIDAARGEYVAFLDDDDLWLPMKIAKTVEYARSHSEAVVIYTDAHQFNRGGTFKETFVDHFPALRNPAELFIPMVAKYAIPLMSATTIKSDFLKSSGLRFPDYLGIDDLALFLEIQLRGGAFGYVPAPLTMRRMHDSNFSGNHRRRFEQRKDLYADLLRRPSCRYTRQQAEALKLGLRDARYRVGECLWEELRLSEARKEFLRAIGLDTTGMQSAMYGLLALLPASTIRRLRTYTSSRRPTASDHE